MVDALHPPHPKTPVVAGPPVVDLLPVAVPVPVPVTMMMQSLTVDPFSRSAVVAALAVVGVSLVPSLRLPVIPLDLVLSPSRV